MEPARNIDKAIIQEMEQERRAAITDGSLMLAPDGTPTTLSEEEWLFSRTPTFRREYGNWEDVAMDGAIWKNGINSLSCAQLQRQYELLKNGEEVLERISSAALRVGKEGDRIDEIASFICRGSTGAGPEESGREYERSIQRRLRQEPLLEQWARLDGCWFDNTDKYLSDNFSFLDQQGEAVVYYDGKGSVYKAIGLDYYVEPQLAIDRIVLHNSLFPETRLSILGFGRNKDGLFQILVQQPFVQGERPSDVQLASLMSDLKCNPYHGSKTDYMVPTIYIGDIHDENVILTAEGNLRVIDGEFRLNTPGLTGNGEYVFPKRARTFALEDNLEPPAQDIRKILENHKTQLNIMDGIDPLDLDSLLDKNLDEERKSDRETDADDLSPDTLSDRYDPQPAPEGKMPPEAQRLTYLMAKEMQTSEAGRLAATGWTYAPALNASKKESPALRPFDKMESEQKRPYLDKAANAVMVLLDNGYSLSPSSEPDVAISADIRQNVERVLVREGRTAEESRKAVDAIEAAGFSVVPGPSKGLKMMEAYFEMATNGGPDNAEDARVAILSSINMARKQGIRLGDINAFIKEKNAQYGTDVRQITKEEEKQRLIGLLKAEYEKSWNVAYQVAPLSYVDVPGSEMKIMRESDFMRVYIDAVNDTRKSLVPQLEKIRDAGLRKEVYETLADFEKKDFFTGHLETECCIKDGWKEKFDEAIGVSKEIAALREKEAGSLKQWENYRWYEKIFIPKPRPDERLEKELLSRQKDASEAVSDAYGSAHADDTEKDVQVSIDMDNGEGPVLSLKLVENGRIVEETKTLVRQDGSTMELSLDGEYYPAYVLSKSMGRKKEELLQELKAAMVLSAQYQMSQEQRKELALPKDMKDIYQEQELRRSEVMQDLKTLRGGDLRKEKELDHRRKDEEIPSLHPNLAGDITPKDVYILKAFMLKGSDGKGLQDIIDALKEKKAIVFDGTMAESRMHPWDTSYLEKKVYIGLRLGATGNVIVTNPISGKDIGTVRSVFGYEKDLDFSGGSSHDVSSYRIRESQDVKIRKS